jgi:hypothetical protein
MYVFAKDRPLLHPDSLQARQEAPNHNDQACLNDDSGRHKKLPQETLTTADLLRFFEDKRFRLDCGHHFKVHFLSNTLVIINQGKKGGGLKIRSECSECYQGF